VPTTSGLEDPCQVVVWSSICIGVVWNVEVGCAEETSRLILNRCERLFVKNDVNEVVATETSEREICPWVISISILVIRCPTH
jgi:hypothetical protein